MAQRGGTTIDDDFWSRVLVVCHVIMFVMTWSLAWLTKLGLHTHNPNLVHPHHPHYSGLCSGTTLASVNALPRRNQSTRTLLTAFLPEDSRLAFRCLAVWCASGCQWKLNV